MGTRQCPSCNKSFQNIKRHICHGGTCEHCKLFFQNIKVHRCPVMKFLNFNESELDKLLPGDTCSRCRKVFFGGRFVRYRMSGNRYCRDCWFEPGHRQVYLQRKKQLELEVVEYLQTRQKTDCALCRMQLVGSAQLVHFEFDHIDVAEKRVNVGAAIMELGRKEDIFAEIDRCRLLCDVCHSVVTRVQQATGLHNIPREVLLADTELIRQAMTKTDSLAQFLLKKRKCSESSNSTHPLS